MSFGKPSGWLLAPIALALGPLFGGTAWAQNDAQSCATAAEQGQAARDDGKYRRAREQFLSCSRDACPGPIRKDCSEWLEKLDGLTPTVVFIARDGDKDVTDVKVTMDGASLTERLDGKPVQVDSGEHVFKFERNGTARDEKILVGAGQKGRVITVNFAPVAKPPGTAPEIRGPAVSVDSQSNTMIPIYVLGGIGAAGLVSFTIFGISGKSEVSDLQDCKPHCAESDVDKARTKLIVADISLGIGVVSLGVAAYLFFTRPKAETAVTPSAQDAKPAPHASILDGMWINAGGLPGGGSATIGGRF